MEAGTAAAAAGWRRAFVPFYGSDYCIRMSMELERILDENFQGSEFLFVKGWVTPTLRLLERLTCLGLPVRTRDHILIHLCSPVETMVLGEFYFQVGRQLPGRLSLKFTRRNPQGHMVIQPTVLEFEEEQQLAVNPLRYLEKLCETARSTNIDGTRMLTTLILLTSECGRHRVLASAYLRTLNDRGSPSNLVLQRLPQVPQNIPGRYEDVGAPRAVPRHYQMCNIPNPIPECSPQAEGGNGMVRPEPVENDETVVIKAHNPTHKIPVDDYAGVEQGMLGTSPNFSQRRRSSGDSSGGRTSLQDDYAGMASAISSLSITNHHQRNGSGGELLTSPINWGPIMLPTTPLTGSHLLPVTVEELNDRTTDNKTYPNS